VLAESIFDDQHHRQKILDLVSNYVKETRRIEIEQLINHQVFEDQENLEEVVQMLQDFVTLKTNNNNNI